MIIINTCSTLACTLFFMLSDLLIRKGVGKFCLNSEDPVKVKKRYTLAMTSGEKITSILHNFIALYHAKHVMCDSSFWDSAHSRITHVSDLSYMVGYGGYFVYELFIKIVRFKPSERIYIVHAITGIFVYCINTHIKLGHIHNSMFILFELSNPFVNSRWFLKNYLDFNVFNRVSNVNSLSLLNDAMLMLMFFGARIVWGTYCTFLAIHDLNYAHSRLGIISSTSLAVRILPILSINALNIYWFHIMVLKLVRVINRVRAKNSGI